MSSISSAQHTFSLAHHKTHPKLHEKQSVPVSMLSSSSPDELRLQTIDQRTIERGAVSQRVSALHSHTNSISPSRPEANESQQLPPTALETAAARYAASYSGSASKQLYMEVVKQLSKDSYGAGQVPISAEVLQLLSAQQEHIARQEQRLQEYELQMSRPSAGAGSRPQRSARTSDTQEFTIGQVLRNPMQPSTQNNTLGVAAGPDAFVDNPYSSGQQHPLRSTASLDRADSSGTHQFQPLVGREPPLRPGATEVEVEA